MEASQLASDLIALGLVSGDKVMVHSSLRKIGPGVQKGLKLFMALERVLGKSGTLLVPTLSYTHVHSQQPVFDPQHTPSSVGGFSSFCLSLKGGYRSIHPTHSIWAYGKKGKEWTQSHYLDHTPVGPNSPLTKLRGRKGKILMLGCGLKPNTSMHGVEELVEPPYLFGKRTSFQIHVEGKTWETHHITHDFDGYIQRYDRLLEYMPDTGIRSGRVGEAEAWLLDAATVWQTGYEVLKKNPFAFVEKS